MTATRPAPTAIRPQAGGEHGEGAWLLVLIGGATAMSIRTAA
ncbi:hypothetical protein ACWEGE_44970 [Amycolatopsis sp. NPDC004747]